MTEAAVPIQGERAGLRGRAVRRVGILVLGAALGGCATPPPDARPVSTGHLAASVAAPDSGIPAPVTVRPIVPLPKPAPAVETYTVVVNEVPVKELLFALARDASVNVDIHPEISGNVTLNAIDQSLAQILDRITRQIDVRYELDDGTLVVMPDSPFLRPYRVNYVNMSRQTTAEVKTSTRVASTGSAQGGEGGSSGGNNSDTSISMTSNHTLWETLETTLREIVRIERSAGEETGEPLETVISNRESGIILVRATANQHELVQRYLDSVLASVTRQVLIEATIVEVELSDRYQAGIDWRVFTRDGGLSGAGLSIGADIAESFIAPTTGVTGLVLNYADAATGSRKRNVQASVRLLNEFGNTRVLSSPKLMTLNNQTAVLQVVDNEVYFEMDLDITERDNGDTERNVNVEIKTVPIGLIMNVTPQIDGADVVTLNVRPTITRIREFKTDPSIPIILANFGGEQTGVTNLVPVVQVRETESMLRVPSGSLAVLGGLMQDRRAKADEGIPGLADLEGIGDLFKFKDRNNVKTELVVFLRPTVIRTPSVDGDLRQFEPFLPENVNNPENSPEMLRTLQPQFRGGG